MLEVEIQFDHMIYLANLTCDLSGVLFKRHARFFRQARKVIANFAVHVFRFSYSRLLVYGWQTRLEKKTFSKKALNSNNDKSYYCRDVF